MKIYNEENDAIKSRETQDEIELLAINKPSYYYQNLEEEQAFEFNNLYFKDINELKLQVKEDNRELTELLIWEKMALELIVESGLPVAKDAEALLAINNIAPTIHSIEKIPLNAFNQMNNAYAFSYNLLAVPNPAMSYTNINVDIPTNTGLAQLKLYDAYNNNGLLETHTLVDGTNTVNLNVQNLISGLYLVIIEIDGVAVVNTNLIVIH